MSWNPLPTDTLDCLDILLSKATPGRVCVRHHSANMTFRRPYKQAMHRAIQLLAPDQRGQNGLKLVDGWEKRVEQAGIHPQILAIIDEDKWMKQMR